MSRWVSICQLVPASLRRPCRELLAVILPIPLVVRFWWVNWYSRTPVVSEVGPVVSLTTHGTRAGTVYCTIESIARGSTLPSRLILWIDDEGLYRNLPKNIRRLMKRGLEVTLCKNYGPHTKYYPFVEGEDAFRVPLVTADDDQLYPKYWLEELTEAYREFHDSVNCHWSVVMQRREDEIDKYSNWRRCGSTKASRDQVALGVSGVIYPPEFCEVLKAQGDAFKECCPKADDLWLHVQAVRSGYKVRQHRARELRCLQMPGSQTIALAATNFGAGNDQQIRLTYSAKDFERIFPEREDPVGIPTKAVTDPLGAARNADEEAVLSGTDGRSVKAARRTHCRDRHY